MVLLPEEYTTFCMVCPPRSVLENATDGTPSSFAGGSLAACQKGKTHMTQAVTKLARNFQLKPQWDLVRLIWKFVDARRV
jgi:hypothetical protein